MKKCDDIMMNYQRKKTPYTNINRDKHRKRLGFKGFFQCLWMLLSNPRTHYVVCTYGIGDAILACGYLRAYQRKHGIRHITLVGKERMRHLYEQYSDQYDDLMLRKEEDIVSITNAFLFDPACYLFMKWLKRFTPIPVMFYYRNLLVNHIPTVNMVNTFKAVIFGLAQDTPLAVAKPKYVPIDEYIDKYKLSRGKCVILSPAARNTPLLPDEFWDTLAARLYGRGYSLIVNHFDYGRDLPHAVSLDCDLSVMFALAEYGGHVISLRSGFCDYMSLTSCRLTTLYPENWDFSHNVLMREWGIRNNISEIQYRESERDSIVEQILSTHDGEPRDDSVKPSPPISVVSSAEVDETRVDIFGDIGRMATSFLGNLKIWHLLSTNKRTHYVLLGNTEEGVEFACGLGERFKKEHDIDHLTMIMPQRHKRIAERYEGCCDNTVCVGDFTYRCLLNAFRFDFAYFRFYEWGRRVTIADAEVFFRLRYAAFEKLVELRDLYEIALMPIRR